jgi:hypothetical protein
MKPPVGSRLDRQPSSVSGATIVWSFWYEK